MILGYRRDAVRLWRTREKAYDETVIRRRWKRFSEFMFWGCFSWDSKGPYYIWRAQSVAERKKNNLELAELNEKLKANTKVERKLSSDL